MGKVIDMFTRSELTDRYYTKEQGEALIKHLLEYDSQFEDALYSEYFLVDSLIRMIENNSGASRGEVLDMMYPAEGDVS